MAGNVTLERTGNAARVRLAHPGKLNAVDVAMWGELRQGFERLQALAPADAPTAVVVCGDGGQSRAGRRPPSGAHTSPMPPAEHIEGVTAFIEKRPPRFWRT